MRIVNANKPDQNFDMLDIKSDYELKAIIDKFKFYNIDQIENILL